MGITQTRLMLHRQSGRDANAIRKTASAFDPARTSPREHGARLTPAQFAKRLIADRLDRDQAFDQADLFADPAWYMLLDLFVAREEGGRLTVSRLCIAAAVPSTTALRWVKVMEASGNIETVQAHDDERLHVALSDQGYARMLGLIENMARRWSIDLQGSGIAHAPSDVA